MQFHQTDLRVNSPVEQKENFRKRWKNFRKGGELHLGGIDQTKFSGSITYVSVTHKGFRQSNVNG